MIENMDGDQLFRYSTLAYHIYYSSVDQDGDKY